jgi:hypothetical protein
MKVSFVRDTVPVSQACILVHKSELIPRALPESIPD